MGAINKRNYFRIFYAFFIILLTVLLFNIFTINSDQVQYNTSLTFEEDNTVFDESNATVLFLRAQNFFNENDLNSSIKYLDQAIIINPNKTNFYNLLFDIHLRENNVKGASQALSRALEIDPENIRTRVDKGKLLMHNKDFAGAKSEFEMIIKEHPNDPYAYNYLGYTYYFLNDFENAKHYFNISMNLIESGVEKTHNFACPYEGLGMIYYRQNNYDESKFYLNKSINFRPGIINDKYDYLANIYIKDKKLNEVIEIIDKWANYARDDEEIIFYSTLKKSYVYFLKGEYSLAKILLENAEEYNLDPIAKNKELGWSYYRLGESYESVTKFQTVVKLDENDSEGYIGLGYSYLQVQRFSDAIFFFEKGLKLNKNSDKVYAGLGEIYFNQDLLSKSKNMCEQALKIDPNNDVALLGLANYYYHKEIYNLSLEYVAQALEANPYNSKAYQLRIKLLEMLFPEDILEIIKSDTINYPDVALYKLHYALLLSTNGFFDESIKIMNELIEISPGGDPVLYSELGFIYASKRDYDNAIENYNLNIELINSSTFNYSHFSCPYDGLGVIYHRQGIDNLTIINLEKAIYYRPEVSSDRYKMLLETYVKLGKYDDAIRIAKLWTKRYPNDSYYIENTGTLN